MGFVMKPLIFVSQSYPILNLVRFKYGWCCYHCYSKNGTNFTGLMQLNNDYSLLFYHDGKINMEGLIKEMELKGYMYQEQWAMMMLPLSFPVFF